MTAAYDAVAEWESVYVTSGRLGRSDKTLRRWVALGLIAGERRRRVVPYEGPWGRPVLHVRPREALAVHLAGGEKGGEDG